MQTSSRPNPYQRAQFLLSATALAQLPEDIGIEVAFAGRSNAGKSSAINRITAIGNLARTSKTPGRTQQINLFGLDEARRLVDLPGYGYAKVPEAVKRQWQGLLERYLQGRESLRGLILMMDIRHPLTEYDRMMLSWCAHRAMPVHILLTKADKLKRGPATAVLHKVQRALAEVHPGATLQLFSALKGTGLEEARTQLNGWFDLGQE